MTCEDFEMKFNEMLNGMLPESDLEEVLRHRESCAKCAEFALEMESVDRQMRDLPPVEVRPEFREKLYEIAIREASTYVSWRPYILRWIAIVAPVSLAFALGRFLPGLPWEIAQSAILLGGSLVFFFESIKPKQSFRGYPDIEEIVGSIVKEGESLDQLA
jgi:hypothetical protein